MFWLEKLFLMSFIRTYLLRRFEAPRVLAHLPYLAGGSCLEIGCGYGAGALLIKHYTGCSNLTSIDIDSIVIMKAIRYISRPPRWAKDIPTEGIEFTRNDAAHLPYHDVFFDAAFHFFVFDHIPEWRNVITEVYRVLKPGGIYSFEDALIPDSPFLFNGFFGHIKLTETQISNALEKVGFTVEHVEIRGKGVKRCYIVARK